MRTAGLSVTVTAPGNLTGPSGSSLAVIPHSRSAMTMLSNSHTFIRFAPSISGVHSLPLPPLNLDLTCFRAIRSGQTGAAANTASKPPMPRRQSSIQRSSSLSNIFDVERVYDKELVCRVSKVCA